MRIAFLIATFAPLILLVIREGVNLHRASPGLQIATFGWLVFGLALRHLFK